MAEDQRASKTVEYEKAEEDRQSEWAIRAEVIYHFFAYRYFDLSSICLDLLNFSDADIDSFNLAANKARGLDNWYVCAEYLKKLDNPTPETNTHRRRLVYHIRSFNKTQPSHFRFYLQNLSEDDIRYVERLCEIEKAAAVADGETKKQTSLVWTTSCVEDEVTVAGENEDLTAAAIDSMIEAAIEKRLNDHRQKSRAVEISDSNADTAQKHADNVDVIREELSQQFERLEMTGSGLMIDLEKSSTSRYANYN